MTFSDEVAPHFFKDGSRFWYRNMTRTGAEYVVINPDTNTRSLLFDNAKLAAVMSMAADSTYDPNKLPFRSFRFGNDGDDGKTIEFRTGRRQFSCDITKYSCTAKDTTYNESPFVLSPDKKMEAFVVGYFVAAFGGGFITSKIAVTPSPWPSYTVGALVFLSPAANFASIKHPLPMVVLGLLAPLPGSWLGARFARERRQARPLA